MLIQEQPAKSKQMTLDEFLDWYPDGYGRFELHDGAVIEMQATGTHEQVGGFLALEVGVEINVWLCPISFRAKELLRLLILISLATAPM